MSTDAIDPEVKRLIDLASIAELSIGQHGHYADVTARIECARSITARLAPRAEPLPDDARERIARAMFGYELTLGNDIVFEDADWYWNDMADCVLAALRRPDQATEGSE